MNQVLNTLKDLLVCVNVKSLKVCMILQTLLHRTTVYVVGCPSLSLFFPESSSQMAADPLISGLRLPDGALMSRHSLRMQPCRDQAKLLCVYVFCFFLLFVGAALQALHCDDT